MNWPVIIGVGILAIALIIFIVRQNIKDEKQLEEKIKRDYPHPKDEEGDTDIEEVIR